MTQAGEENRQLLKRIEQEFDHSGGKLALSKSEFTAFFKLKKEDTTKIIEKLIATGRYSFIKDLDERTEQEVERIQVHPVYARNYWIRSILDRHEANALIEIGALLEFPINSGIRHLEEVVDRHAIRLKLSRQRLTSLPDTIGDFPYLTELKLQDNRLESLPDTIGNLQSLQELYLHHNKLKYIPETIGNLKTLEVLDLAHNALDHLPDSIGSLRSLRILDLDNNQLSSLPDVFSGMKSLRAVRLRHNKGIGHYSLPKTLLRLPYLLKLLVGRENIIESDIDEIIRKKEEREKELHREEQFLHSFEKKFGLDNASIKKKEISVDFFINHVLPEVIVINLTEGDSDEGWYLYIETMAKDNLQEVRSGKKSYTVTFAGIGFNIREMRWDKVDTFVYYIGKYDPDLRFRGFPLRTIENPISHDKVIEDIREEQERVSEGIWFQDMTLKEIKKTESRAFRRGWIETLELTDDFLTEEFHRIEARGYPDYFSRDEIEHILEYLKDTYYSRSHVYEVDVDPPYTRKQSREDFYKGAKYSSEHLTRRIKFDINCLADAKQFLKDIKREKTYLKRPRRSVENVDYK